MPSKGRQQIVVRTEAAGVAWIDNEATRTTPDPADETTRSDVVRAALSLFTTQPESRRTKLILAEKTKVAKPRQPTKVEAEVLHRAAGSETVRRPRRARRDPVTETKVDAG